MRVPVASLVGLALLTGAGGCQFGGRVRLERELRAREIDVRELREELDRSEAYNQSLFQDLRCLRGDGSTPVVPGEHVIGLSPVKSIILGRQTGGYNTGSCPGDDALQVQVEPRDPEGHAVKVAGSLAIQILEINKEGVKRPISAWDVSPEQLRKGWRQGLLSSGYLVTLPWKEWPNSDKLRVVAQFHPIDGRVFEAEKDITVHLPPLAHRPVLPPPESPPGTPAATDLLPAPHPVSTPAPDASGPGPVIGAGPKVADTATAWRPVAPPPPAEILRPVPEP